jgi:hypothetical protein
MRTQGTFGRVGYEDLTFDVFCAAMARGRAPSVGEQYRYLTVCPCFSSELQGIITRLDEPLETN